MTLRRGVWAELIIAALWLSVHAAVPEGWVWPPADMHLPMAGWLTGGVKWLTDSAAIGPVSLKDVTRGISRGDRGAL